MHEILRSPESVNYKEATFFFQTAHYFIISFTSHSDLKWPYVYIVNHILFSFRFWFNGSVYIHVQVCIATYVRKAMNVIIRPTPGPKKTRKINYIEIHFISRIRGPEWVKSLTSDHKSIKSPVEVLFTPSCRDAQIKRKSIQITTQRLWKGVHR